jgi:hypothetical protein
MTTITTTLKAVKVLKEVYKTYDGAWKRCGFENGVASSEFKNGYKAKLYRYTVKADEQGSWRVVRNVAI